MTWARFDDRYSENPKIESAGPWAELLDMRAIIYCARNETDGLVTRTALSKISAGIPAVRRRAERLVEVGRWTVNEGGGWLIHDFLEFNPSKAQVNANREQGRERQRAFRSRNAVTSAFVPNGSGKQESKVPKLISRCSRCNRLDIDCECVEGSRNPQADDVRIG